MHERTHALDTLRALAMFLGIVIHASLAYTVTRVPFWPAVDPSQTTGADIYVFTVHQFRMQVFFLLAGYFGCMLLQRDGLGGLLAHRLRRIGVPLLLAMLTVQPLMQLLWLCGEPEAMTYIGMAKPDLNLPLREVVLDHISSGAVWENLRPTHLWFLYYLLLCFAAAAAVVSAVPASVTGRLRGWLRGLFGLPGRSLLMSVLLFPSVDASYRWTIDTPDGWVPRLHILGYYLIFFGLGWQLYRWRDELLPMFTAGWRRQLLLANLLVLPVQLSLVAEAMPLMAPAERYPEGMWHFKLLAVLLGNLYTWLMVAGLMGLALRCFRGERAWVRYLADASYWAYLLHLLPVIALQLLLRPLPWPAGVKLLVVTAVSLAVLLASYERFVRRTWVGVLLNGRRR